MKTMLPVLLLAASFVHAQTTGDPVVAPKSTERFLEGVPDFAGGSTLPGKKDPEPLSYPNPGGASAPPASAQKPSGPVTKSTLQGQKIERPNIKSDAATGQKVDPAWQSR